MWIGTGLGIVFLLSFSGLLFWHYYQDYIKFFLFNHFLSCFCCLPENSLEGIRYDAFVSFSHEDEDFVYTQLVKKLEEEAEKPFKLCIHTRDWGPGEWIDEQIYKSVEQSRRTIIVLSRNFLASRWSLTEFHLAHKKAVEKKGPCVIIILYDINVEELVEDIDSDLRMYLRTNTYIKWGEPSFWSKLKVSLKN